MEIERGMLVKTLSGTIVKTEKQVLKGCCECDDGRTHLEQTFREVDAEERKLYAAAHSILTPMQDNKLQRYRP